MGFIEGLVLRAATLHRHLASSPQSHLAGASLVAQDLQVGPTPLPFPTKVNVWMLTFGDVAGEQLPAAILKLSALKWRLPPAVPTQPLPPLAVRHSPSPSPSPHRRLLFTNIPEIRPDHRSISHLAISTSGTVYTAVTGCLYQGLRY